MSKLDEKLKKLAGTPPSLELLNKDQERPPKKPVNRGNTANWGGKRKGAGGVKPTKEETIIERGRKAWVEEFYESEMMVQVTDPKTGQVRTVAKNRTMIALEKLFTRAVKGEGETDALDKFLNRSLGRAKQPITGGDEGDEPIKHEVVGFEEMIKKAYGNRDD